MGRPLRYATAFPPTMLPSLRRDYSHHKKERFCALFLCVQYEDLNVLSSPREEAAYFSSFLSLFKSAALPIVFRKNA